MNIYIFEYTNNWKEIFKDSLKLKTNNDWNKCKFTSKLKKNGNNLIISIAFKNKCDLYIDDFNLEILRDGIGRGLNIKNSSFEKIESDTLPQDWSMMGIEYKYNVVTNEKIGGSKSLHIRNNEEIIPGSIFKGYPSSTTIIRKKLINIYFTKPR